eukprot:2762887-Amphidinium_carterae.1
MARLVDAVALSPKQGEFDYQDWRNIRNHLLLLKENCCCSGGTHEPQGVSTSMANKNKTSIRAVAYIEFGNKHIIPPIVGALIDRINKASDKLIDSD